MRPEESLSLSMTGSWPTHPWLLLVLLADILNSELPPVVAFFSGAVGIYKGESMEKTNAIFTSYFARGKYLQNSLFL